MLDEVNVDVPDCLWERLQVRPKSLGTWPIGHQVTICGLIGAPEDNGKKGKVAAYLPEKDRYKVRLDENVNKLAVFSLEKRMEKVNNMVCFLLQIQHRH